MRLNGWRAIADYLKCGVRSAQRWQQDLHMPVMRVRNSKRGAVLAESDGLDEWMRRYPREFDYDRLSSQFTKLKRQVAPAGHDFLRIKLATGQQFVVLAQKAINGEAAARRRNAARRAYDSIQRHLAFKKGFPQAELNDFNAQFQELKSELEKLGERF